MRGQRICVLLVQARDLLIALVMKHLRGSDIHFSEEQIVETLREVLVNGLRSMYGTQPSLDFLNALTESAQILNTQPTALAALVDAHREPASDSSAVLSGRAATGEGIGEALNS